MPAFADCPDLQALLESFALTASQSVPSACVVATALHSQIAQRVHTSRIAEPALWISLEKALSRCILYFL